MTTAETLETFCAVHPDRETGLRCISCDRYMCVECAVRTPVGYRCRECVRGQQAVFYKGNQRDDILTFAICLVLTAVAVAIVSRLPLGIWIALIAGLPLGAGISEVALRATQRRRSRQSHIMSTVGAVVGGLLGIIVPVALTYNELVTTYNQQLSQLGTEAAAQIEARGGMTALGIPDLPQYILRSLTSDIGVLLLIGLIAAAIYGRYKMRM